MFAKGESSTVDQSKSRAGARSHGRAPTNPCYTLWDCGDIWPFID